LIVQRKLAAFTNLITVSRARGWSEQAVRWPHRRGADNFSPLRRAGWRRFDRPQHRRRPGHEIDRAAGAGDVADFVFAIAGGAVELWGLLRPHPDRRALRLGC
jgi:hypothetical protein